jgi:hypothetical protein
MYNEKSPKKMTDEEKARYLGQYLQTRKALFVKLKIDIIETIMPLSLKIF